MIADASHILREEARVRFPTLQYHQDRILRLKAFLGWSERRVRSIYNAEDGVSLRGAEAIRLQELAEGQRQRARNAEEAANADGYKALAARFAALEAELASLRAAIAGGPVEASSDTLRGQGGRADHSRPGSYGRRSTDRV